MKKLFFLFALLASMTASATVTVTPLGVVYSTKVVTFKVEWTATPSAPYNNRVWVWVDFCSINGTSPGSFTPATITSSTITGGNGTITNATARGFFIEYGATNAGTTVTATLSNAPADKFNWCVYGSDDPPNATAANGTYTLKGTPPFIINGTTTLGAGVNTYSGGCITSLTDQTGCPGIINYAALSAGAINSSSTIINTNATPAAITSNTAASSGGGITYRWVRSGSSGATYTDNNAGHSFAAAEINTAGAWTYYREVRDNTCATTTWNRSSGSYILTVTTCSYTGSDLYMDATHLCQQRTSGAKNWEAYIKDSRDGQIYRITQFSDNSWWFADYYNSPEKSTVTCEDLRYYSILDLPTFPAGWALPTLDQIKGRWPSANTDTYGGNLTAGYSPYSSVPRKCEVSGRYEILAVSGCSGTAPMSTGGGWSCNSASDSNGRIRFRRQL